MLSEQEKMEKKKLAENFIADRKLMHALQVYHYLLDQTDDPQFKMSIAMIYWLMGNISAYEKYLLLFLEDYPDSDYVRFEVSTFLMDCACWESTIEVLSVMDATKKPEIYYRIGYSYFNLKNLKLARKYFELYLNSDYEFELKTKTVYYLGLIDLFEGNYDQAINKLKECEFYYNSNSRFYYFLANAYRLSGMYTHASLYIMKSIRLSEKYSLSYLEAAVIFNALKQFDKSEKFLQKYSVMEDNNSFEFNLVSAETYIGLGKFDEAQVCLTVAEQENPNSPQVQKLKNLLLLISEAE